MKKVDYDFLIRAAVSTAACDSILSIDEVEPGRLKIFTKLFDPRGQDGSDAAKLALEISDVAVRLLKEHGVSSPYVAVLEWDGTHFALNGHPLHPNGSVEI